jgi:hypothetical protein
MKRIVGIAVALVAMSVAVPAHAESCATGGACRLGEIGPGGGRVIVVSTTPQWWGSYIEARPVLAKRGMPWSLQPTNSLYSQSSPTAIRQRIDAMAVGMGGINTTAIINQSGPGNYAAWSAHASKLGTKTDWVLPSRDELDAVFHLMNSGYWRGVSRGAYWSSSENSAKFAWYQIMQDGTQFTDENGVGRINGASVHSSKDRIRMAQHGGSGFPQYLYRVAVVRYFGAANGVATMTAVPALTGHSCTADGPCSVGDLGPGGGVVFYDAGQHKYWGRYLEAAPESSETSGLPWKRLSAVDARAPLYANTTKTTAKVQRIIAKSIGTGATNTLRIVRRYGKANYAARYAQTLVVNGYDDWFLPSEDELFEMYKFMHANVKPLDSTHNTYYWSSSEYDLNNAWTVNFKDGQQFDREKYLVPKPGVKALRIRAIRAFG